MKRWMTGPGVILAAAMILAAPVPAAATAVYVVSVPGVAASGAKLEPMNEISSSVKEIGEKAEASSLSDLASLPGGSGPLALVCVNGWPIERLEQHGLTPLAVAEKGGMTGTRWVLLAREGASSAEFKGKALASRALPPAARALLGQLLFSAGGALDEMRVVEVSKSLDALLALRSGQVDLALVERLELDQVVKVAPAAVKGLAEVRVSPEMPFAVLAVRSEQAGDPMVAKVVGSLVNRGSAGKGGIDRWVEVRR